MQLSTGPAGILENSTTPSNPACRYFREISSINWEAKRYEKGCDDFRTNFEGNVNKMQPC